MHILNIIDKTSPIPLYVQVSDWLQNMITEERYKVGAKLPSQGELAEKFQLNRNTIRHAVSLLVQKGFVEKQKGMGTFVKRKSVFHPIYQLGRLTSFVDDFNLDDVELEDKTILKNKIRASRELAEKLMINENDDMVQIDRVRIANKTPLILERQFYSFKDFGELLDMEITGSIYQILIDRFNADLNHSIQTIRAVTPPGKIAQVLGISTTVPCILLESLAYTSRDVCIEVLQSFYRGDRYLFKVETDQYERYMRSVGVE